MVLNPGDESRVGAKFEPWYALCPCDPESERQNLGSRNRRGALGDFDCGSFPALSQIITTIRNGRPVWPVGLSGFQKWGRITYGERGSRLSFENEAPRHGANHGLPKAVAVAMSSAVCPKFLSNG